MMSWSGESILEQLKIALSHRESRILCVFAILNLGFMIIEIAFGLLLTSPGLISHGVHSAFDFLTLFLALLSMAFGHEASSFKFTYGYERHECLAAFTNSCFLIFLSFFLIMESLHRLTAPPVIDSRRLLQVSTIGFILSMVELVALRIFIRRKGGWTHYYKSLYCLFKGQDGTSVNYSARETNIQVIFLHLVADCVSSSVVVVMGFFSSSSYTIADPLASLILSLLLIATMTPICKTTGELLLQSTPAFSKSKIDKALKRISSLEGVLEVFDTHFWSLAPGSLVGTVHVLAREDIPESQVLAQSYAILEPTFKFIAVEVHKQIDDDVVVLDGKLV